MGAGQSKFISASKSQKQPQQQQYPYNAPFPSPYGQPPYPYGMPAYPNANPMYPPPPPQQQQLPQQGFVPHAVQYGQAALNMPPPQLNWLPQDKERKKRRSRRTQSERFPNGFDPTARRDEDRQPRRRSGSTREGPIIPGQTVPSQNARRAPTPFIHAFPREHESEGSDEDDDVPRSANAPTRFPEPPPIVAELANVIEPLEPANAAAFGPTGPRPHTPLRNPLPPPPRDLYEMTPYKSLLSLPQTTALLTATYGPQQATVTTGAALEPTPSVKSKKGGLLRAFSRKDKPKPPPEPPQVRFIPVFVPQQNGSNADLTGGANLTRPPSQMSRRQSVSTSAHPRYASGAPVDPSVMPVPPIPSSPPAIRFDQAGKYGVFMNHSPHRIIWEGREYPTALHLHEALKFMPDHPEIAEQIRMCPTIHDVYPLATQFAQYQKASWSEEYLQRLEDVLYQKFRQHADLRALLLSTVTSRIIYVDPNDEFWGVGAAGTGQNKLGQILMIVRDRLQDGTANLPPA